MQCLEVDDVTAAWPAREQARLGLLERVLSKRSPLSGLVDPLAGVAALSLDVPVALVSLIGRDRQFFIGQSGASEQAFADQSDRHSLCRVVVEREEALIIPEVRDDPVSCENPAIREFGVRAYAGEPIIVRGRTLGSCCAFDVVPRVWTDRERAVLRGFADVVEALIEAQLATENELSDARDASAVREAQQSARLAVYEALSGEETRAHALNRRLEHAMAPKPVSGSGLGVEVFYHSGSDRLALGGNFVDTLEDERGTLHFVLGDVSGSGPEAAALAIGLRSAWRALQAVGADLLQTVAVLDRQTAESALYATLLLGSVARSGRVSLLNAGHPEPVAVGHVATELNTEPGPMLGLDLTSSRWQRTDHELVGQTLLAYSDGLVDDRVHRSAEHFGIHRLITAIDEFGPDPEALCRVAGEVAGHPLDDDVVMLRITTRPRILA